ncbi:hypothetical protein MASR2M15_10620 [Anaerolineales bacterium]
MKKRNKKLLSFQKQASGEGIMEDRFLLIDGWVLLVEVRVIEKHNLKDQAGVGIGGFGGHMGVTGGLQGF